MVKKIRRRRIVVKQRELIVLKLGGAAAAPEICPFCKKALAPAVAGDSGLEKRPTDFNDIQKQD